MGHHTAPGPNPAILDDGTRDLLTMLLTDVAPACIPVPAHIGVQGAALIRAAGLGGSVAGRVADALDGSVLAGYCLLNVSLCDAAALVLGDIADTAVPQAVRAGELGAFLRARAAVEA